MGSIEEEDLTSSLDFEFYDLGCHKDENVEFKKVYSKPPPGRPQQPSSQHTTNNHRFSPSAVSTPNNKVYYENSTFNGSNNKNVDPQLKDCNVVGGIEMNGGPVSLMNGGDDRHYYKEYCKANTNTTTLRNNTTVRNNVEEGVDVGKDGFGLFKTLEEEDNDVQSGLDVSISDDTEDEEEGDGIYKDIYKDREGGGLRSEVDGLTDDEGEGKERSLVSLEEDEDVSYSGSEITEISSNNSPRKDLGSFKGSPSVRSDNNLLGKVPNIQTNQFKYGSACSSEESSSNDSESDLSSLDDDDDDVDEEECCCSDDGDGDDGLKSTDDDDDDDNTNKTNKTLGKDGPTAPRRILRQNGLSFERYSLKLGATSGVRSVVKSSKSTKSKRNNCSNNLNSSSSPNSDMNCNLTNINNISEEEEEDSFSSASEMTDVSPLASSAENSPTLSRKAGKPTNLRTSDNTTTIISVSSSSKNSTKNGFSCTKKTPDMDMNLILQAVEEISKEDDDDKWKRCSAKLSSSSSSSSPIRKRNNNRTNLTYSNERAKQIERENERLLAQLLKLSSSSNSNSNSNSKSFHHKVNGNGGSSPSSPGGPAHNKKLPLKSKVSHSAINRQRELRRIDKENEAFLRRLQSAKASNGLTRDSQLEEYNSKHLKCPRSKSATTRNNNNGSPFKRPFTATSSSGRNSIISLATADTNNSIDMSKRNNVYHQQSSPTSNRPEWVSKW